MRKLLNAVLIILGIIICFVIFSILIYEPPAVTEKTQREIEGDFIAKANAMAQHLLDIDVVYSAKGTKILVFPDKWNKLSERERLDFVRTWGRAKKMAQDFEGRIEVNGWIDDTAGYPPFMYYDVGNDEFIYSEK